MYYVLILFTLLPYLFSLFSLLISSSSPILFYLHVLSLVFLFFNLTSSKRSRACKPLPTSESELPINPQEEEDPLLC